MWGGLRRPVWPFQVPCVVAAAVLAATTTMASAADMALTRAQAAIAVDGRHSHQRCQSFTIDLAELAALSGATYVSIFSGRVQDMGYDVRPVIAATRGIRP